MIWFYRIVYFMFFAFIHVLKVFLPKKIQELILERKKSREDVLQIKKHFSTKFKAGARPILVHGSSGEIESARPLIRQLKKKYPETPIVLSYFSPSARALVKKNQEADAIVALPWDFPSSMDFFIRHLNPSIAVFSRGDLWPELVHQLQQKKIPSILIAFSVQQKKWNHFLSRCLYLWVLNKVSQIHCVDHLTHQLLQDADIPSFLSGDPRYDQAVFKLAKNTLPEPPWSAQNSPILVLGSTWKEDQIKLMEPVKRWLQLGGKVVWAPHEWSEDFQTWIEQSFGAEFEKWSQLQATKAGKTSMVLVDTIGDLAFMYAWARLAFVGGSFKKRVHSVLEPLCNGTPVFVGPHHQNSPETLEFMHISLDSKMKAVTVFSDQQSQSNEMAQFVEHVFFLSEQVIGLHRERIQNAVDFHLGSSDKILNQIERFQPNGF